MSDGAAGPARRRVDVILDEGFLDEVEEMPTEELRARRSLCDEVDTELSYYRRLLHGRMDLLAFELRRRRGEETRSLIDALPDILVGQETVRTSRGRVVPVEVPDFDGPGRRPIDRVLSDDFLARLPTLSDDELEDIQRVLTDTEADVSAQRRGVYEVFEKAQAELARRYRDGLADADEVLQG
jgi:succinate dehydrogenase flavin-adding protein (antitoxin of CptAB toxin-antitoxin module)